MKDTNLRWAVEASQNLGRKFWEVRAAKDKPKEGELLIYGPIWGNKVFDGEVAPGAIRDALKKLGDVETIKVYVNSKGGDVFAGNAIHNILRRHPAQVIVYIDGLAASAASVIAAAGDRVIMPKNSMQMVHRAWSFSMGNAIQFEEFAGTLRQIDETLIAVYMEKTKLSRERIVELVDAETWMTASEAVAMGFADELEEAKAVAASVDGDVLVMNGERMDLTMFRNPPSLIAQGAPAVVPTPAPKPPDSVLASLTADQLNELLTLGVITQNEWANGRRALAGLPPLEPETGQRSQPNNSPTGERRTTLSHYLRREAVHQRERRLSQ